MIYQSRTLGETAWSSWGLPCVLQSYFLCPSYNSWNQWECSFEKHLISSLRALEALSPPERKEAPVGKYWKWVSRRSKTEPEVQADPKSQGRTGCWKRVVHLALQRSGCKDHSQTGKLISNPQILKGWSHHCLKNLCLGCSSRKWTDIVQVFWISISLFGALITRRLLQPLPLGALDVL